MGNNASSSVTATVAVAFAVSWGVFIGPTARGKSVTENMADGAVVVAAMNLNADPESEKGMRLLEFALTIAPDHERGLLLSSRARKGLPLDDVAYADGGKRYVKYLLRVAEGTKSSKRKLLLYKIVELVEPGNEKALVELTRGERKGIDVRFEALLESVKSKSTAAEGGERRVREEKPQDTDGPTATRPADANKFRGHWYKVYREQITWPDALEKCRSQGGYLVCIADQRENEFVKGLAGGQRVWLGASDAEREGKWQWCRSSAETWRYSSWVREPRKYDEEDGRRPSDELRLLKKEGDYLYMCPSGRWNARFANGGFSADDTYISTSYRITGFVCEWDK